jgi:heme/copper-type cytochrome/quinol oxidase subunit 2
MSFKLLYLMDEVSDPAMSVLAEGHQWYWSYQYSDFLNDDNENIEFDSYMIPEEDLEDGGLRMLEVDNRVILPELTHVRFIITSADVIHSFSSSSLAIKCDAYPGRLNAISVLINREGVFFGRIGLPKFIWVKLHCLLEVLNTYKYSGNSIVTIL